MNKTELTILLIVIYIIGIFIWMLIEKRYFLYEEGEYKIEFDGAHEIDEDIHNGDAVCRSILWPLFVAILIIFLPMKLLLLIFENL